MQTRLPASLSLITACVALALTPAVPAWSQGVDNTASSQQASHVDGNSFTRSFAFTTDASADEFTLDRVTLRLVGVPANPGGARMSLYTDNANLPGTLVGHLSAADPEPFVGDNLFEGTDLVLSASTTYWLSFNFADAASPFYRIPTTFSTAATTGSWTLQPGTLQGNGPNPYRNSGDYFLTSISGSPVQSAVPEPSSFAALAGLVAMGFVASRRRRR